VQHPTCTDRPEGFRGFARRASLACAVQSPDRQLSLAVSARSIALVRPVVGARSRSGSQPAIYSWRREQLLQSTPPDGESIISMELPDTLACRLAPSYASPHPSHILPRSSKSTIYITENSVANIFFCVAASPHPSM